MKRILYVFALMVVSAFAAEAQQRVVLGTMDKAETYLLKPDSPAGVVAATSLPVDNDSKHKFPAFLVAEETIPLRFTVRVHPFPEGDQMDTTRSLQSVTNPDSTRNIGDVYAGLNTGKYMFNGFSQFVPFSFYYPELQKGNFRVDSILFLMYPANGPVTSDVELWVVAIPQKYNPSTTYKGYNFDLDNSKGIEYLSEGPLLTMTADSINAHLEGSSIRPTILDLQAMGKSFTVATDKMWGIVLVKSDRNNTDQLALIGTHEWGLENRETFGGIVAHYPSGIDSVVALWKTNLRWSLSTESYPAYANQVFKINYRMNFYGEYKGEVDTTGGTSVEPVSKMDNGFTLEQNTPNPVNGDATIQFSINTYSPVTLRVYNTLGQEVAELANGNFTVGTWKADFNTKELPAGSYVYVLNANGQTITRTMQVIR